MSQGLAIERTISLDRERVLRLDFRSARAFQKASGISLMRGGFGELNEGNLAELIWALGAHEDPKLTISYVAGKLDFRNMVPILATVADMLRELDDQAEEGMSDEQRKAIEDAAGDEDRVPLGSAATGESGSGSSDSTTPPSGEAPPA